MARNDSCWRNIETSKVKGSSGVKSVRGVGSIHTLHLHQECCVVAQLHFSHKNERREEKHLHQDDQE